MVEELQRLSCENKRLNETLIHMRESYNALQRQLMDLTNKNCEEDPTQLRKRKAESTDQNCFNMFSNMECSTSEEESCKRPRETVAPKISRVLVRTEASDTSLVSSLITQSLYLCLSVISSCEGQISTSAIILRTII